MRDRAWVIRAWTYLGRRSQRVAAAAVTVVSTLGAGCSKPDSVAPATKPGAPAPQQASAARLGLVGPAAAVLTYPPPGEPGVAQLTVGFRLNRSVGLNSRGNARAQVRIEGVPAEFVSRVGRKQVFCYVAAPIDAPKSVRSTGDGAPVSFAVLAMGQALKVTGRARSETGPGRLQPRPPGCAGRKE